MILIVESWRSLRKTLFIQQYTGLDTLSDVLLLAVSCCKCPCVWFLNRQPYRLHVVYFIYYVHVPEGLVCVAIACHIIVFSLQVHRQAVCPLIVQFLRQYTSCPPLAYAFNLFQREHYIVNLPHAVSILMYKLFNPVLVLYMYFRLRCLKASTA